MCVNVPFFPHFVSTFVTFYDLHVDDSETLQRFLCAQLYNIMYHYVNKTVAYIAIVSEATYIKCGAASQCLGGFFLSNSRNCDVILAVIAISSDALRITKLRTIVEKTHDVANNCT